MRIDPFLPRLRAVADTLMMPGVSIYDMYPRLGAYDHVIYVFPRRGEWHVIVEPPVVTSPVGLDPSFPENGVLRIETGLADACGSAERIATVARAAGRTAVVVADVAHAGQRAPAKRVGAQ